MVKKTSISELANEYKSFYKAIITESASASDKERACYGLEQVTRLLQILEEKNDELTNSQLRMIHNIFTNMTRGVEYFETLETEQEKRKLGIKLYAIKKEISAVIVW